LNPVVEGTADDPSLSTVEISPLSTDELGGLALTVDDWYKIS